MKLRVSCAETFLAKKPVSKNKYLGIPEQVALYNEERKTLNNISPYLKLTAGKVFIDGVILLKSVKKLI
ncbi:hypothetical protein [Inconstantimicrobium porci]|uniref:hypothetical protein n=1 Tax=Inconstantimicrobium porci TaxID=2652291 RepID=UPI00240A5C9E|nr:hypothetical protein [Inconstantimicrobium porci]MDD6771057.1 hypothetical protein [Inconstantimicrobium porci]